MKIAIPQIVIAQRGTFVYNAKDAKGFERGEMGYKNGLFGEKLPNEAQIYSVYKITREGFAHCESIDANRDIRLDVLPLCTLEPLTPRK